MIIYENGTPREMTEEEIKKYSFELRPEEEIEQRKQWLADTNDIIIKMTEGELTREECSEIIAKRRAWRKEINELEAVIDK